MKKLLVSLFVLAAAFVATNTTALAQTETASGVNIDTDVALLRRDLRGDKKKLIAMNLPLTETEATKFWPLYDRYAADMSKVYDDVYALIKDYAQKQKTITDAEATGMLAKWADVQVRLTQTRQKYIPIIETAIPGRKAVLFFQIDRRLYALIELQVAAQVPLLIQEK